MNLRDSWSDGPRSIAVDARNNLLVADGTLLLKVTTSSSISAARVPIPVEAVTFDPAGHLFYVDRTGAVREVVLTPRA